MAKMDYIERRKLRDEVVKSKMNNPHLNEIQRQAHIHEHRSFQRMIVEQPAADVVEVVRCKDCGYYHPKKNKGYGVCNRPFEAVVMRYENEFCSGGIRQ
jgi:hypothetical protein